MSRSRRDLLTRRGLWAVLLSAYAIVAVFLGTKPLPTCLGLGDQTACIEAWKATLAPVDRLLYDVPTPLAALALFVSLTLVTILVVAVWGRRRARAPREPV